MLSFPDPLPLLRSNSLKVYDRPKDATRNYDGLDPRKATSPLGWLLMRFAHSSLVSQRERQRISRVYEPVRLQLQFPGLPPATAATAIRNLTSFPSSFKHMQRIGRYVQNHEANTLTVFLVSVTKARDKLNRESSARHREF